jgi:hypothetical protein
MEMVKPLLLDAYPGVKAFYACFGSKSQVQDIIKTGGKFGLPFGQCMFLQLSESPLWGQF